MATYEQARLLDILEDAISVSYPTTAIECRNYWPPGMPVCLPTKKPTCTISDYRSSACRDYQYIDKKLELTRIVQRLVDEKRKLFCVTIVSERGARNLYINQPPMYYEIYEEQDSLEQTGVWSLVPNSGWKIVRIISSFLDKSDPTDKVICRPVEHFYAKQNENRTWNIYDRDTGILLIANCINRSEPELLEVLNGFSGAGDKLVVKMRHFSKTTPVLWGCHD